MGYFCGLIFGPEIVLGLLEAVGVFFGVEILAPIRSSLALEIRNSLLGRHFSVKNSKVLLGGLRFMYEANMSTLFAAGRSMRA